MKNLFLLPTDKPSRLIKNNLGYGICPTVFTASDLDLIQAKFVNNYITNDEEIKDGEYGLSRLGEIIKFHSGYDYRYYAKIILTTDQDLIEDGVQAIDDKFLEWFVKNPSCDSVDIKTFRNPNGKIVCYKITIPQEEQSVQEYEQQGLEKSYSQCERETLEEVAERFYGEEEIVNDYDISGYLQSAFLTGAKWQQEPEQFFNDDRVKTLEKAIEYLLKKQEQDKKMYSELSLFLEKEADKDRLKSLTSNQIRTLIEQFKKK
jgi:hypothetical protein